MNQNNAQLDQDEIRMEFEEEAEKTRDDLVFDCDFFSPKLNNYVYTDTIVAFDEYLKRNNITETS